MQFKNLLFTISIIFLSSNMIYGQIEKGHWVFSNSRSILTLDKTLLIGKVPASYKIVSLATNQVLPTMHQEKQVIQLPTPEGKFETFIITPTQLISPEQTFDGMAKTYSGHLKRDPSVLVACSIYDQGFYGVVYGRNYTYSIEPVSKIDTDQHIVYNTKELKAKLKCSTGSNEHYPKQTKETDARTGNNLRNLTIAISSSGEYSQQFGGSPFSKNNVHNAIISGLAIIEPVFRRDLGVVFTYVPSDDLIFQNPSTDPFDYSDQLAMIDTNNALIKNTLGTDNFDIGQLLIWENLGGLAWVGGVCDSRYKGGGFSGANSSQNYLWMSVVAHELGHLLGSSHNHSTQNCGTNQNAGFRYEPGDGSSIMSYPDLCENSYTSQTVPYFHYASIRQIDNNLSSTSCYTNGGNISSPSVDASSDITIPRGTPFVLVGTGDAATYNWIQYDGSGPAVLGPPSGTCTNCTNFRYNAPTSEPVRYFPTYDQVLAGNNSNVTWEKLSSVARTMNFRLVGRNAGSTAGVGADAAVVTVSNNGPFQLTFPNGGETVTRGTPFNVTWDVNGTNLDASTIDILFSEDNGVTYTVLVQNTPNDGSESVTINSDNTSIGRILIQANTTGNTGASFRGASTFYDVSDLAFGVGVDPAPPNDNYINAIEGFYGQTFNENLEHATTESSGTPDYKCNGTLTKDIWYKFKIQNGGDFSAQCSAPTTGGTYMMQLNLQNVIFNPECLPCNSATAYTFPISSDWTGRYIYVRVFEKTSTLKDSKEDIYRSGAPQNITLTTAGSTALPIELYNFTGETLGGQNILSWKTASEVNASHFEIETSTNGTDWFMIGLTDTQDGDSYEKRSYSYTDREQAGQYYRLKLVDLDGAYSYSKIVLLKQNDRQDVLVYPNPVKGNEVHLSFFAGSTSDVTVQCFNTVGKKVYQQDKIYKKGRHETTINTSTFAKGIYYIKTNVNGTTHISKLLVE